MKSLIFATLTLIVASTAHAEQRADSHAPELASGVSDKKLVTAAEYMVSAANPHASRAAQRILQMGGNAVDAMIATQLVLGLVEPQSSGLGGGAFLVYWDAESQKLTTIDGRETAPQAAGPDLFLDESGEPLKFFDAVIGGRSVGTPGTVALMELAHRKWGGLGWEALFAPAIGLAEGGFEVSPRLNTLITASAESLFQYETTRNYFLSEEGVPLYAGTVVTNLPYAETLKMIARDGSAAFYGGEIAQAIVDTVNGAADNPGLLTMDDLANYEAVEREPVCAQYRSYSVCGMGPPSSGALTVGQILGLVEHFPLGELGPDNPESWRIIGDASRLAFADRGKYMADSDFVKMPKGLLNKEYLAERAAQLRGNSALPRELVAPGDPPADHALNLAPDVPIELPSTSHFSIVDNAGNVVSMTTTIENAFGSRLMTRGFLLNNELTDFSFVAEQDGIPVANRVEGGKRPRSSMSPTIVLENGKPILAIGSPGGSRIIPYVAKTLIAVLDWKMNVQQAINLPHLVNRFGTYDLEAGTPAEQFAAPLEALGYPVSIRDLNSGLHAIRLIHGGEGSAVLEGGADPRREGVVLGE